MKRKVLVVALMATVLAAGSAVAPSTAQASSNVQFLQGSGRINFMVIQEPGRLYGPPPDAIAVEVVIKLDRFPNNAFGLSLRNNANLPAHQAMLDILRDAFFNNIPVTIDYNIIPPKTNGIIIKVSLQK